LAPVSTMQYVDEYFDRQAIEREKVYTPVIILALMALARLLGFPFRLINSIGNIWVK
jgi:hypothetical protein